MSIVNKTIFNLQNTALGEPLEYKDKVTKIKEQFGLYHGKGKRKKKKKKK